MALESTVVCVDNSEYMRNGDFLPSRLHAQQDAVKVVCHSKRRSHPENNVALMTMSNPEVLASLTTDVGRLLYRLAQLQPKGDINFVATLRVAHVQRNAARSAKRQEDADLRKREAEAKRK